MVDKDLSLYDPAIVPSTQKFIKNLSPTLFPNTPPQFYAGKLEMFLTCRAVAAYLKNRCATYEYHAFEFQMARLRRIGLH